MLNNIDDQNLRSMYGRILNGDITKQVRCMSKSCNGRVIATIDKYNNVSEVAPLLSKRKDSALYASGLEGSRIRLDGEFGFRCYCGNESILAKEEAGIITPAQPNMEDLEEIAKRLAKRQPDYYKHVNGLKEVDAFIIEDFKG